MKKSGICPKCESKAILPIRQDNTDEGIVAGWTVFSKVPILQLLCCDCGYLEQYIESHDAIQKLTRVYGEKA